MPLWSRHPVQRRALATLALLLVFAVAIEAQTPDGKTPAVETVCDNVPHNLKGLCNAFCEAKDCDSEARAADAACSAVLRNYHRRSAGVDPPCLTPRETLYGTDGFNLYTIDQLDVEAREPCQLVARGLVARVLGRDHQEPAGPL